MYLIMDYVPNHTSDQHEWFKKSVARDAEFTDYYVWVSPVNASDPQVPNNWVSFIKENCW